MANKKSNPTERQPLINAVSPVAPAAPAAPAPHVFRQTTYWILFLAYLSLNTGYAMVLPSLWPYFESLGGSKSGYSWAAAVYSFGQTGGALMFGWMSDRYATRWVLTLALVFAIGGAFIYAIAWNQYAIYIARVVWGVGGGCAPVLIAAAARLAPLHQRARAVSIFNLGGTMGYVLGPGFAALTTLIDFPILPGKWYFDTHTGPGWVTIFVAIVISVGIHLTNIPPPARNVQTAEQREKGKAEFNRRLPLIGAHWLINFVLFTNLAASEVISTPFTFDNYHWTVRDVSSLWLVNSGLGLGSYLFVFFFAKNLRGTVIVWVATCVMVVGGVLAVNWRDIHIAVPVTWYIASAVFTSTSLTAGLSCNIGIMAAIVSPTAHGKTLGINNALGSLARATAPLWSVPVYAHLGPSAICGFLTCVIFIAFVAAGFLWRTEGPILDSLKRPRAPSAVPAPRVLDSTPDDAGDDDEYDSDALDALESARHLEGVATVKDHIPAQQQRPQSPRADGLL